MGIDRESIIDLSYGFMAPPELKLSQPKTEETLRTFKAVIPVHVYDDYYEKLQMEVFTIGTPADVDYKVDTTTMTLNPENLIQLTRARSADYSQIRKKTRPHRPSKFYLYVSLAWLSNSKNVFQTGYEILAHRPKPLDYKKDSDEKLIDTLLGSWENVTMNSWQKVTGSGFYSQTKTEFIDPSMTAEHAQLLIGFQFTQNMFWHADIKLSPYQPAIRIPIDSLSLSELFKDRDKSESGRKAALKAWVSEHWRRQPMKNTDILISSYLRGRANFTWRGLNVQLLPSADDLKKIEKAKKQPKQYRLTSF